MDSDRIASKIDRDSLIIIFERLHEKTVRKLESRRAIEALRSKIKHLDPPVTSGDTWEVVRPRLEKTDEFRSVESEDVRRSAFEKYVRRLKEKDFDDRDREGSKYRHRDERERDHRNGHGRRRHGRTRSPESDPYEADRKKAQADRERQYTRKSERVDRGVTGLSPPPLAHRPGSRDGDHYDPRRDGRLGGTSYYERERREHNADRERTYVSRKDPRDQGSELDYGDGGSGGATVDSRGNGRRRRESDQGSQRSNRDFKRPRRSNSPKEDAGIKSGSEEGEIEEM